MTFLSVEDAMAFHRLKMKQNPDPMLRVDLVRSDIRTWFIASFGQYLWLDDCPFLATHKVTNQALIRSLVEEIASENESAINARVDGLVDPPSGGAAL